MRVALISDLHGNALALRAVVAQLDREGIDQLVCLGDVATLGPHPHEVLDILARLNCACILGNHDEFLLEPALIHQYTETPIVVDAVDWCRASLSTDELAFVRTFRRTLTVPLSDEHALSLFHGSPHSHMDEILATTPEDKLAALLSGEHAVVMAGGHTHLPLLRHVGGALLVNPGSLGLPFSEHQPGQAPVILPHAAYAVVSCEAGVISARFGRVPLSPQALAAQALATSHPMAAWLAQQYARNL